MLNFFSNLFCDVWAMVEDRDDTAQVYEMEINRRAITYTIDQ